MAPGTTLKLAGQTTDADRRRLVHLASESLALSCVSAVVAGTRNIPRKGGVEFPRVLAQFLRFALDSGEFLELLFSFACVPHLLSQLVSVQRSIAACKLCG